MDFIRGEIIAIDKPLPHVELRCLGPYPLPALPSCGAEGEGGTRRYFGSFGNGCADSMYGAVCTKQIETLQNHTKEYTATLQLGATTDSYDMEHPVNKTFPWKHITREKVEETLKQFVGDIDQVPPTYSACKIEGKRAYKMRRDGEQVELKPKHIHIDSITLTSFDADKGQFAIDVVCGKGTYIRALARDIGRALDSGAYLTSLRRTRVGDITIDDCASFDHFEEWLEQNDKHNDGE